MLGATGEPSSMDAVVLPAGMLVTGDVLGVTDAGGTREVLPAERYPGVWILLHRGPVLQPNNRCGLGDLAVFAG